MAHSQETIEKAEQIKKETGCIKIWGVHYSNTDNWIKIYTEAQFEFMKEVVKKYSIFSSILKPLFENGKKNSVEELREAYFIALDNMD